MTTPITPLRNLLLEFFKKSATTATNNPQQPYANIAATASQTTADLYYADSLSSAKANEPAPLNKKQQPYANSDASTQKNIAISYYSDSISSTNSPQPTSKAASTTTSTLTETPTVITATPVNAYYIDKISKAEPISHATVIPAQTALALATSVTPSASATSTSVSVAIQPKRRVDAYYEELSLQIDNDLAKGEGNFERLRNTIDKVIMLLLRMSAVADQERIFEIVVKVKNQAHEIKGTYNKWQGTSITVISAGVSITAAIAGLTPLLPAEIISGQIAQTLAQASMQIGTMSTGLSGFGSLFSNREEGNRTVYQVYLKRFQDQEEEKKGAKHSKSDLIKNVNNTAHENLRNWHDTVRAVLG